MTEHLTVNELMVLMKSIRDRLAGLRAMRSQVSTTDRWLGDAQKIIEPVYDVKKLDKKIVELENFLFRADSKIKTANAKTVVDLPVDVDKLLEPLE